MLIGKERKLKWKLLLLPYLQCVASVLMESLQEKGFVGEGGYTFGNAVTGDVHEFDVTFSLFTMTVLFGKVILTL